MTQIINLCLQLILDFPWGKHIDAEQADFFLRFNVLNKEYNHLLSK